MKRFSLLMLLLAAMCKLPAQTNDGDGYIPDDMAAVYFSVKNQENKPVKDVEVRATDNQTTGSVWAMTDNRGNAYLRLYKGHSYTIKVPGNDNAGSISIAQNQSGIMTMALKCDPPAVTTSVASTDTVLQTIGDKQRPGRYESMVKIKVLNVRLEPQGNVRVTMHGNGTSIYAGVTKDDGYVRFILPQGQQMMIDIGKARNISQCTVPNSPDATLSKEIRYEPTNITETVKNDTIRQDVKMTQRATSERACMHILVNDLQHHALEGEDIYLDDDSSNAVYAAVTNAQGKAVFLVPKGKDYMLHFKYERNVDHIRLATAQGLHNISIEFGYVGSKKIEEYYATSKRDTKGFLTDFMEGHVEYPTAAAKPEYTFTKTADGFSVTFDDEEPAYAPAVSGNNIFTCGGYYNNKMFSIDNATGKQNWCVQLAEGGASPGVISNNYLLVNTESCSLYVIDISTGKCVWSKWLSEYLYTGPTVANDKVYAVYKNNLGSSKYVLACFDLKSGKVLWQNWVSAEGIASPVVQNNQVFLTTRNGRMHCFEAATGKEYMITGTHFCSAPTVTDEYVYVSCRNLTDSSAHVALLDRKTFTEKTSWSQYKLPADMKNHCEDLMNSMAYQGSRVTIANGNAYFTNGETLVCADAKTGKQKWSMACAAPGSMMSPVVAGKKIVAGNSKGDVLIIDGEKGVTTKKFESQKPTNSFCVDSGKIYTGTANGKVACFDTGDATMTGSGTWCYNAAHNPVIK